MVAEAPRGWRSQPAAVDPPPPSPRDWALVAVLVVAAVLEGLLRPDVAWRPAVLATAVGLALTLPWRRTRPLAVVALGFGTMAAVETAAFVAGLEESPGLYTQVYLIILPYSLLRWADGRSATVGLAVVLGTFALTLATPAQDGDVNTVGDAVGAGVFLLTPAALGAWQRARANAQARALHDVKARERQQLARELHDTVAHHVSGIAIRAQAGRALAPADPGVAVDALSVIEEAASRALAEMRLMVGLLRSGEGADLAPLPGIDDLGQLVTGRDGQLPVDVETDGGLDDLGPSVEAAVYRIVQEAITNARRHARNATRIRVRVSGEGGAVRVVVHDDGERRHASAPIGGYGLLGMRERAVLLGGSFEAGPDPHRGWTVAVTLPARGGIG